MKIWKAELHLYYSDNGYKTRFYFELLKKDYEFNEKYKHWSSIGQGWLTENVPKEMIRERGIYSVLKVIQGFDYELNEEELKQLEKDMRNLMREQVDYEKEEYLKQYESKLKVIGI